MAIVQKDKEVCAEFIESLRAKHVIENLEEPDKKIRTEKACDFSFTCDGAPFVLEHTIVQSCPLQISGEIRYAKQSKKNRSIAVIVTDSDRSQMLKEALLNKCPKLTKSKPKNGRSILLLELLDHQTGSAHDIRYALPKVFRELNKGKRDRLVLPDDIYAIAHFTGEHKHLYETSCLRKNGSYRRQLRKPNVRERRK
jgi:hypothetical protein